MSTLKNQSIDNGATGMQEINALHYARGDATLAGGSATVNIGGFSSTAQAFVQLVNPAGTPGFLAAIYSPGMGQLTITSTNALDDSDVSWLIID